MLQCSADHEALLFPGAAFGGNGLPHMPRIVDAAPGNLGRDRVAGGLKMGEKGGDSRPFYVCSLQTGPAAMR